MNPRNPKHGRALAEIAAAVVWLMVLTSASSPRTEAEIALTIVEESASSVIRVLKYLIESPSSRLANYCALQVGSENDHQRVECVNLVKETAPKIIEMYEARDHLLQIWNTFESDGEYGGEHLVGYDDQDSIVRVAASTELGPEGPIWFDLSETQRATPTTLFFMIYHELLHKVPFQDKFLPEGVLAELFVSNFETGRALINSAAHALKSMAIDMRMVASDVVIVDRLTCTFTKDSFSSAQASITRSFDMFRNFSGGRRKYRKFEVQLEKEDMMYFGNLINLEILIKESFGCQPHDDIDFSNETLSFEEGRFSRITLISPGDEYEEEDEDEVLGSKTYPGMNPVCQDEDEEPQPIILETELLDISCIHEGYESL